MRRCSSKTDVERKKYEKIRRWSHQKEGAVWRCAEEDAKENESGQRAKKTTKKKEKKRKRKANTESPSDRWVEWEWVSTLDNWWVERRPNQWPRRCWTFNLEPVFNATVFVCFTRTWPKQNTSAVVSLISTNWRSLIALTECSFSFITIHFNDRFVQHQFCQHSLLPFFTFCVAVKLIAFSCKILNFTILLI